MTKFAVGSTAVDLASIADGNEQAVDVTITGAQLGDFTLASHSLDVTDLMITGSVTAADTVTVIVANNTGGALDIGSGTIYAMVIPREVI